jgi:hypothetical protein
MTKDEALDLALEALENLFGIPDKFTGEGGGDVAVWRLGGSYRAQQAITAIKQARSAQRQWVGLTDEEIMSVAYQAGFEIHEDYDAPDEDSNELHWWSPDYERCDDTLFKLRDLIEAKLKEKNT